MYLIICNGGVLLPNAPLTVAVGAAGATPDLTKIMVRDWGWPYISPADVLAAFGPRMPYDPGNSIVFQQDMTLTFSNPADGVYFWDATANNWQPFALNNGTLNDTLSGLIAQYGLHTAPIYLAAY